MAIMRCLQLCRPLPHPLWNKDDHEVCLFVKDRAGEGHKAAKKRLAEVRVPSSRHFLHDDVNAFGNFGFGAPERDVLLQNSSALSCLRVDCIAHHDPVASYTRRQRPA